MMASAKPRSNMTMATMMYMIPIFLWSTEVSHSLHSHFHLPKYVISASSASPPTMIAATVTMMIGSCNGTASSVNFPNIRLFLGSGVSMFTHVHTLAHVHALMRGSFC